MIRLLRISLLMVWALTAFTPASAEDEREGGIIGTGIVGTITKLGSIWVNGQHIELSPKLRVADSPALKLATGLQPGHTVAVIAEHSASGWVARYVRQVLPLVGPIEAVSPDHVTIMGTEVRLPKPYGFNIGDWVAVSGLWQDNRVIASRLDAVPAGRRVARISGSFIGNIANGQPSVGQTRILRITPRHARPGDFIVAYGTPVPGGLKAKRLEKNLFAGDVGVMLVEGYLSPPAPDGVYSLLGSGLVSYTDNPGMIDPTQHGYFCGGQGKLMGIASQDKASKGASNIEQALGCK